METLSLLEQKQEPAQQLHYQKYSKTYSSQSIYKYVKILVTSALSLWTIMSELGPINVIDVGCLQQFLFLILLFLILQEKKVS